MIIVLCNDMCDLLNAIGEKFHLEPLAEDEAIHLLQTHEGDLNLMRTNPPYLGDGILQRLDLDKGNINCINGFIPENAQILFPVWENPLDNFLLEDNNYEGDNRYYLYRNTLPEDAIIKWWRVVTR